MGPSAADCNTRRTESQNRAMCQSQIESSRSLTLLVFDARLLSIQMVPRSVLILAFLSAAVLAACGGLPGLGSGDSSTSPKQITYDGAILLTIKNGQTFPGTAIGYLGKAPDGRATVTINGQQAPKSTADSVNFSGSPIPGTVLSLSTRVGTYDDNAVNLFGTIHLVVDDPVPQMGNFGSDTITGFGVPVQYTVNKGEFIPGSTVQYLGKTDQGAQFSNVEGFPYRQQLDSIVWNGQLRDKVGLHLDLRLLSYSEDSATFAGTAEVRFEK
jgi:hypothetical protein